MGCKFARIPHDKRFLEHQNSYYFLPNKGLVLKVIFSIYLFVEELLVALLLGPSMYEMVQDQPG